MVVTPEKMLARCAPSFAAELTENFDSINQTSGGVSKKSTRVCGDRIFTITLLYSSEEKRCKRSFHNQNQYVVRV